MILNQRVSAVSRFIHKAEWDANGGAINLEQLDGRQCYAGLDLGATRDLTAFVMVFPDDKGRFDVVSRFFMPEANIEDRSNEDRVPYDLWAKQGLITLIPGATIDPGFIADALASAAARYEMQALAYDRWRIEDLRRELGLLGATLPLTPFGQGFGRILGREKRTETRIRSNDPFIGEWFGLQGGVGAHVDPQRASGLATAGA